MTPEIKEEGTTELSFQVPVLSVPQPPRPTINRLSSPYSTVTPEIKEEGTTELSFQVPVLAVPQPTRNQTNADETLSLQMLRQAKISGVETVTPKDEELSIKVPSDWVNSHVGSDSERSIEAVMVDRQAVVPELGSNVDPPWPASSVIYSERSVEAVMVDRQAVVPELGSNVDPPASSARYKYAGYETAL